MNAESAKKLTGIIVPIAVSAANVKCVDLIFIVGVAVAEVVPEARLQDEFADDVEESREGVGRSVTFIGVSVPAKGACAAAQPAKPREFSKEDSPVIAA